MDKGQDVWNLGMILRLWLSVWASVSSSEKCESWYLPALRMFQESLPPSQLLTFSPQVGRGGQGSQRRERKGESQIAGRRAADLTRPTLAFAWTSPGYSLRAGMEQGGQNWTCYGLWFVRVQDPNSLYAFQQHGQQNFWWDNSGGQLKRYQEPFVWGPSPEVSLDLDSLASSHLLTLPKAECRISILHVYAWDDTMGQRVWLGFPALESPLNWWLPGTIFPNVQMCFAMYHLCITTTTTKVRANIYWILSLCHTTASSMPYNT